MSSDVEEVILTVPEAAAFAKVAESVIRRWMAEGLRHLNTRATVGQRGPRGTIIRRSELVRFIEAHETGTGRMFEPQPSAKPVPTPATVGGKRWWKKESRP